MSDPLSDSAPANPGDAPSVEDQALPSEGEVDTGSGSDEETIPVERFNGLMSSLNKVKEESSAKDTEIATLSEQLAAVQTQLEQGPTPQEENEVPEGQESNDSADLRNEVAQLKDMLSQVVQGTQQTQVDAVRSKVLEEFPEVAPFADLIVADDEAGFREVASDLASRVAQLNGSGTGSSEQAPAATESQESSAVGAQAPVNPDQGVTAPPAAGGGPPVASDQHSADEAREAIKSGDFAGWARARFGGADDQGLVLEQS